MSTTLHERTSARGDEAFQNDKSELVHFMKESRNLQNCYHSMIHKDKIFIEFEDVQELNDFVFIWGMVSLEKIKREDAAKISDKIIGLSRQLKEKSICITVGIIYHYAYKEKNKSLWSFFKIHLTNRNAIFIDSYGRSYDNWKTFLEDVDLPLGLMCVPKDGDYSCTDSNFQLQYVTSGTARNRKSEIPSNQCQSVKSFFSKEYILEMLQLLKDKLSAFLRDSVQLELLKKFFLHICPDKEHTLSCIEMLPAPFNALGIIFLMIFKLIMIANEKRMFKYLLPN